MKMTGCALRLANVLACFREFAPPPPESRGHLGAPIAPVDHRTHLLPRLCVHCCHNQGAPYSARALLRLFRHSTLVAVSC